MAGVNGAGKSSVGGAAIQAAGGAFYNPDLQAKALLDRDQTLGREQANSLAWNQGRAGLVDALANDGLFAFETTLGARTFTDLLIEGAMNGARVHVWYAGLDSPELHIARVRSRVAAGGHAIADDRIRERYVTSRQNLVRVMPVLTSLRVHDNSREADPKRGVAPEPLLVLSMSRGRIDDACALEDVPTWAKPLLSAAIRIDKRPGSRHPR